MNYGGKIFKNPLRLFSRTSQQTNKPVKQCAPGSCDWLCALAEAHLHDPPVPGVKQHGNPRHRQQNPPNSPDISCLWHLRVGLCVLAESWKRWLVNCFVPSRKKDWYFSCESGFFVCNWVIPTLFFIGNVSKTHLSHGKKNLLLSIILLFNRDSFNGI